MGQTCNHVAAAMYRIEAAVRNGLTNPSCTNSANEWLPNHKDVVPTKVKDLVFNREDFAQKGKKKRSLVATPKKLFNPLSDCTVKTFMLDDVAKAIKDVAPDSILHTVAPKPEIDFAREVLTTTTSRPTDLLSVDDILLISDNKSSFFKNLSENMTITNIMKIEVLTRGQNTNKHWYMFRKAVITASKCHNVSTKMDKVMKGGGGYLNMWSLNQNVSGLLFVNPDIPALKYGRSMEENAVNNFYEIMKLKHIDLKLHECGLYLDRDAPYIGGSPDRIVTCSCCPTACLEVK